MRRMEQETVNKISNNLNQFIWFEIRKQFNDEIIRIAWKQNETKLNKIKARAKDHYTHNISKDSPIWFIIWKSCLHKQCAKWWSKSGLFRYYARFLCKINFFFLTICSFVTMKNGYFIFRRSNSLFWFTHSGSCITMRLTMSYVERSHAN